MEETSRRIKILLESKEAEGSIKNLKNQVREWTKILEKAEAGSEEYVEALRKIKSAQPILEEHKRSLRGIQSAQEGMVSRLNGMASKLQGAFAVGAAAGLAMEVFRAGKELANMAIQQEQLAKKAATVFGPALDDVTTAAKRNATAMGLTTAQYVSQAAAAADLLIPMGFTRDQAAGMSTEMTNLSGALAEWSGGTKTATEVNDIMTKALLGERDGLKSLGISISEADVQRRLAENGMDKLTGTALEQAKAMATLQLITEKSTDAQTSFAEGGESNARKMAEMGAKITDIAERLAMYLLPVFSTILDVSSDLITIIENVGAKVYPVLEPILEGLGEALGYVKSVYEWLAGISKTDATAKVSVQQQQEDPKMAAAKAEAIEMAKKAAADAARKKAAEEAAKKRAAEAQKQHEADIKAALDLQKSIDAAEENYRLEQEKNDLTKALAQIEQKYAAMLEKAVELERRNVRGAADARAEIEAQIELEKQAAREKDAEQKRIEAEKRDTDDKNRLDAELAQMEAERLQKEEWQRARDEEFLAGKQEIADKIHELLLTDNERELAAVDEQFKQLIIMAEAAGMDTAAIKKKYLDEIAATEKKAADKTLKTEQENQRKRLAAYQSLFQGLGDAAVALGDLLGGESERGSKIQKVAALAQIAMDTASAISSLTASSEAVGAASGPAAPIVAAATFAAGLARILVNIKKAKDLLTAAPKVEQKFGGGWTSVEGATDGQTYSAKYLGQVGTGLLNFPHPVVLANERGMEYFVDHASLRNPAVLNHVRAIENLKGARLPQFAEGGATAPGSAAMGSDGGAMMMQMMNLIGLLYQRLSQPIEAVIYDRTITDMAARSAKISAAAGGRIQTY